MADFTGSILELKGSRATVLTDKCDFLVIKKSNGMFVGQQISFNKSDICTLRRRYSKYLAIAASICVIICSYFLYYQFYMPSKVFAYIDVDINPSVEFTVDKNQHVIEAKPLNGDAESLLKNQKFDKLPITEAVDKLIKECEKEGFIKPETGTEILVSGSTKTDKDKDESQLSSILSDISSKVEQNNSKVAAECINVKPQERAEAVENNISMGRYALFNKIKADDSSITVEQAKSSGVSDIIEKAKGKSHLNKGTDSDKPETDSTSNKPEESKASEGYSDGQSNDKKDNNKKQNEDKSSSSGYSGQKNNDKQDYSDGTEPKKESGNGIKDKSGEKAEDKDGQKSDSRSKFGAAATPTPKANDISEKDSAGESKKNNNNDVGDSREDVKDQTKHTDNDKGNNNPEEHTEKNKK